MDRTGARRRQAHDAFRAFLCSMMHKSVRKSAHVHDGREMVHFCSILIFMEMILWHGWCFREVRQQGACDAHPQPTIHRQRPTRSPSHSRPSGRHALRPPPRRASRHRNHGRLLAHVTAPLRRTCPVRCPPPYATLLCQVIVGRAMMTSRGTPPGPSSPERPGQQSGPFAVAAPMQNRGCDGGIVGRQGCLLPWANACRAFPPGNGGVCLRTLTDFAGYVTVTPRPVVQPRVIPSPRCGAPRR